MQILLTNVWIHFFDLTSPKYVHNIMCNGMCVCAYIHMCAGKCVTLAS